VFPQHENHTNSNIRGAVVVVIAWQLNLQQYVQSIPITTKVVSLNLDTGYPVKTTNLPQVTDNLYYIMILFKQFYWLSCCHLTFRQI
jgi:hypothetical protein